MFRKIQNILFYIVCFVMLVAICISVVIYVDLIRHPDEIPSFFGWKPFIVVVNDMKDEILNGDIAFVKEYDVSSLEVGNIIAYKDDKNNVTICRILKIKDDLFFVNADNATDENTICITNEQIEGKFEFRIGKLGGFALVLQKPIITITCILFPLIIILISTICEKNKDKLKIQKKL